MTTYFRSNEPIDTNLLCKATRDRNGAKQNNLRTNEPLFIHRQLHIPIA